MFSIFDTTGSPFQRRLPRRELLRIGSLALGGLTLPGLLRAVQASETPKYLRNKSVVLLHLQGGPPQIETFDPKFDGPDYSRSVTGDVQTAIPGVRIGGTFPKIAKRANRLSIVRNFAAGVGGLSHENGYERMLTGGGVLGDPPIGALYSRITGSLHPATGIPSNALILPETIDPQIKLDTPSQAFTYQKTKTYFATAGTLGEEFTPFDPSGGGQLISNMEMQIPRDRFDDRRELLSRLDHVRRQLDRAPEVRNNALFREQAYDVLLKGISQAFDLSKEEPETMARYDTSHLVPMNTIRRGGKLYWNNFNRTTNLLGKQMLLARRLCEAGCGFVTVLDSCWDFHDDGNNPPVHLGMNVLSPQLDHAVSAFLDDVEARGLSEQILLIITAEMGRTPRKEGKTGAGSGHWGELTPLVFAGGGLKMGQVVGNSDRTGSVPDGNPYTPAHLMTTIMQTLFDLGELRLARGIPEVAMRVANDGEPIRELV